MSLCNDTNAVMTMPVTPVYNNGCNTNGNGNGMWGNESWWFFIVILALFGGFGNGFGGGYGGGYGSAAGPVAQGYDTRADLQRGFDTQSIIGKLDGINNGICSLGYDQLNQMNGINSNIAGLGTQLNNAICSLGYNNAQLANGIQMQVAGGFSGLSTDLCQLGSSIQQGFNNTNVALLQGQHASQTALMQGQNALQSQIADCCCTGRYEALQNANATQNAIQQGFCQTNYNLATQSCDTRNTIQGATRDLLENSNANTRAILDKLTSQEIAAKDAQIAAQNQRIFGLELKASQEAQNNYLVGQLGQKCPQPSYLVCNPNAGLNYSINYGNPNCGCNNGCGC